MKKSKDILAVVGFPKAMDMCNSEILSYSISKQPSAIGIMTALKEAIKITSDCPYRQCSIISPAPLWWYLQ